MNWMLFFAVSFQNTEGVRIKHCFNGILYKYELCTCSTDCIVDDGIF